MNTLTIMTNPRRLALLTTLGLLLLSPLASAGDPVSEAFARSYTLEARGKYAKALVSLKSVHQSQQHSYIYQLRLGWLNYLARKHGSAVRAYKQAARLAPLAVEPLQGLLLPQIAARRWKDALATTDKILGMAPGNYLTSTRRAWILFNLGRYREAAQAYEKVLRQYPANLTLRAGLGWARARQGRLSDAAREFRAILRYSSNNKSAAQGLAWVQKKRRR